ncbi:putative nucleotidyltransferase component of viral defense system [Mucilaginibacter sp. UYP25]|uniref:nucleotidyl transferase AbiEii/AbiGii toxin family protein n=1 Tax=unclassified Mucilaginibacter TaxID=2617802 RepID=UPI003399542F
MITPKEINKRAAENRVNDRQIEKDYVLTWVLTAIADHNILKRALTFKGGTVLKKCYFDDYRFSEDLDFTLLDYSLTHEDLVGYFNEVFAWVKEETNITLQMKETNIHAASGSSQFYVDYIGPLGGNIGSRDIKVDITRGEVLVYEPVQKMLFTDYSDMEDLSCELQCYPLSEVLIEKMAALMGRTEPRDFYDFWYFMEIERMDLNEHWGAFEQKAARHKHDPAEFAKKVLSKEGVFGKDWVKKLQNQIHDLDRFEEVFRKTKRHLK